MKTAPWLLITACAIPLVAQNRFQVPADAVISSDSLLVRSERASIPPLHYGRIAGEILTGTGSGFLSLYAGVSFGLAGVLIGYPLGVAIGVSAVGNIGNETGSFGSAFSGATIGMLADLAIISALRHSDHGNTVTYLTILAIAPIVSTIFFNLTREYDQPTSHDTALLQIEGGTLSLSMPQITMKSNHLPRPSQVQSVDLLKIAF